MTEILMLIYQGFFVDTCITKSSLKHALHEKCPNTEFFLVCIFLYLDQKKLCTWTLFTQWWNLFYFFVFDLRYLHDANMMFSTHMIIFGKGLIASNKYQHFKNYENNGLHSVQEKREYQSKRSRQKKNYMKF